MSRLVLPDDFRRRARLPEGPIRLADGRLLAVLDRIELAPGVLGTRWRSPDKLMVLGSEDDHPLHGKLAHISVSYPSRNPSWEDIRAVRDAFFPDDTDVMMVLPRKADYVNYHQHCFHLWQTPSAWGIR